jgi:hypothetical protein
LENLASKKKKSQKIRKKSPITMRKNRKKKTHIFSKVFPPFFGQENEK